MHPESLNTHHATQNPNQHAKLGAIIPILAILIPLAGLGAAAWTLPADLIPLPKQSRTCMVTGGGTLRLHTRDCGTLYIRGRVSLNAGDIITVTTTGPIAWKVDR